MAAHFSIDQSLVRFEILAITALAYQLCVEKDGGKTQWWALCNSYIGRQILQLEC